MADPCSFVLPEKPRRDRNGKALPEARIDACARCGNECTHEYVYIQPRVWGYRCTLCRRERQRLERGE